MNGAWGRLRAAALALLFPLLLHGQGSQSFNTPISINARGEVAAGTTITVCSQAGTVIATQVTLAPACTPTVSIFSDPALTVTKTNPFQADGLGNWQFFAAPGLYTFMTSGPTISAGVQGAAAPFLVLPCVVGASCPGAGGGGGSQVCTTAQLGQQTDIYVAPTGNDSTGNGTVGNPYLTIPRAVQDVPFLVCGRYVIHLAVGTYNAQVVLAGRVFGGGGYVPGIASPNDTFWPISGDVSVTDNTWPYSWVEIVGSTAAPASYVINYPAGSGGGIFLSHANLTLRGVTVDGLGFGTGVKAAFNSVLNLAGVVVQNASTLIMGVEQSLIHIDASGFVNNDGVTSLLLQNTSPGGQAYTGFDAIEIADRSFLTDMWSDGNNTNPGTLVKYVKSTGNLTGFCIEEKYSFTYLRGSLSCQRNGLKALDGDFILASYTFDGQSAANTPCVTLDHGVLSEATLGGGFGGPFNCSNSSQGVSLSGNSMVTLSPIFTSVTTPWLNTSSGTQASPTNVRSVDSFTGVAFLKQAVTANGAFTISPQSGSNYRITLTGNSTLSIGGSISDGQKLELNVCQDATGGRTLTLPASFLGAGTIAATASKCNKQTFDFDQPTGNWYADGPMVTGM